MLQPLDVIVIVFLFFQSIWDIRSLEAEPVSLAMTAVTGIFYMILEWRWELLFSILMAFIPGILIWMLSLLSRGKIGLGDVLVVLTLGFFANMPKIVTAVMLGSILSFICAAILMGLRRKDGDDSLPFLPFILAGYVSALLFVQ